MERWAYEDVLSFVRSWDAVWFGAMFIVALIYAYLPRNQEKFRQAAQIPLEDENA